MSRSWYVRIVVVGTAAVCFSHGGVIQIMGGLEAPSDGAMSSLAAASRDRIEARASDVHDLGEPFPAAARDTVIEIRTEGPNLAFMPDRISLKTGTRVTIRYTNAGVLPHNFVLLRSEDDLDTVGMAAFDAEDTGYVPVQHKDLFIAYTELAKPGNTVEVTFVVPEPGEYTFACLYPGHYNMMLGTLRSLK